MTRVCLIFPGQGAQEVGMGKEIYETSVEAREIFEEANIVIPGLTDIIFNGPADRLTSTGYCQPAIYTYSIAALTALQKHAIYQQLDPQYTCGLSLGECSAVAASGALSFEEGLMMVKHRAAFMEEACRATQGSMAAIIGFDKIQLKDICDSVGASVANYNSPDQIVITGEVEAVTAACKKIKEAGAKRVIPLTVSGAFHSTLMAAAVPKFRSVLDHLSFNDPKRPLISNVDAQPAMTGDQIKSNLSRQIISSVLWEDSINYVSAQGVRHFIEIGPGNVLKGLLRQIDRDLTVFNVRTPGDIEKIKLS
ncbi:MAG: ACP S-malonyltransferase [Candidatus Omnitrophica bacterium]|nr:ACP S-malonyltransferase [Candidatus Omnitrophota bacterium]